jgi:hypothetical protein
MNEQEDIIKFRTDDHYREHAWVQFYSQSYQSISSTASPPKCPTPPEYSPVNKESTDSSSTSSDDSTDDSDDDSTLSSSDDDSSPMPMHFALYTIVDF